jgi:myo-inositol-1-phosphate synthase
MTLRRRKSKKAKAADAVGSYLKLKTAGKAAKGAKKAAKGTAAYQVAKRTPLVRRIPVIAAGAGVAAFAAAKLLRSGNDSQTAGA